MYKDIDPSEGIDPKLLPTADINEKSDEDARKVYAMVSNIDDNLNRLFEKVEALGIEDNTIIIFMTDNGPQQARYGRYARQKVKCSPWRHKSSFFFMRYPQNLLETEKWIKWLLISIFYPHSPNFVELHFPQDRKIDGRSFVPALQGKDLTKRSFFPIGPESFQKNTIT